MDPNFLPSSQLPPALSTWASGVDDIFYFIFWVSVVFFVGIVGAIIGNLLAGPLFGIDTTIQTFNLPGFLVAIVGAIVLLAIANLVQRGRVR